MPTQPTPGTWTVGQYTPSEKFKAIQNHSCVCDADTMALICVTGPADDRQSQIDADLFAASKELLAALEDICLRFPQSAGYDGELWVNAHAAIAKARGETHPIPENF